MSDTRQVKVDNWGIYFLQRLKHFFNRTDYCDLTLQFQDNAQLKVHRLVLSACTEYFELLERTCEMYEDCLVMPEDLQADVVVPIINFMYTGQLEFKLDLLEKLYQTSLVMNLPILTKLLDAHRPQQKPPPAKPAFSSGSYYGKRYSKPGKITPVPSSSNKRSFSNAFENTELQSDLQKTKKPSTEVFSKAECIVKNGNTPFQFPVFSEKNKRLAKDPRPTRYELPEELDEENLFDNSFSSISYGSKPLMVHPETTTKQYGPKRINLFEEGTSTSSRFMRASTNDIVECRKIPPSESIFLDSLGDSMPDENCFQSTSLNVKDDIKDNSQLFDQILDNKSSKITIETKNNVQAHNLDHAKIISEVLKKYPHLVKNNKNIKLKILNTTKTKKTANEEKPKQRYDTPDFTYESDVINSKEAAKLIALGAENVAGPWICLICGTPGKALHFTSYYNFRKHLVDIHNEKPIPSMCEYCGVKSQKRNYIVHHKLTKHGVAPPPAYTFPKCNQCTYVALNEALLVKHKTSHTLDKCFKYNIPSVQLASVAQKIGKKYPNPSNDRKGNKQCVYCMRTFLREHNLYAHLKIHHKEVAKSDGLIDDSEEEQEEEKFSSNIKVASTEPDNMIKVEVPVAFENTYEDINEQYQIEQKPDGSICVSAKKPRVLMPSNKNKILNLGFSTPLQSVPSVTHTQKTDSMQNISQKRNEFPQNTYQSHTRPDTVIIDNDEYILQDNHLIPKKEKMAVEYVMPHTNDIEAQSIVPTTSVEYHNIHNASPARKMLIKKTSHVNHPYQIVVSSEEEYKALMNTNQSVLYDESDTNKALSEVGGNSSLGTGGIDLDTTQSNDMMIIPDYHMNVPETVSGDNSNIVVVYSHPVENQNKQYSIITTQGEFVQSSAILTQNYETVTTCTPVTSHTAIENSWPNNIHASINKLPIPASAELQTMAVGESITIAPMEDVQSNRLNELAEIQLTTAEPVTIEIAQTEMCPNTFDESNIISAISHQSGNAAVCQQNTIITLADPTVLNNMQQVQIVGRSFDQGNPVNSLEEQTTADIVASNTHELEPEVVEDMLHQNTTANELMAVHMPETGVTNNSIIEDTPPEMSNTPVLLEHSTEPTIQQQINVESDQLQETIIESQMEDEETIENIARDIDESRNVHHVQEQCITTIQSVNEVALNKVTEKQIENLTSEWSEDESEATVIAEEHNILNTNSGSQNVDDDELLEPEESIENIQKEVDRQVSEALVVAKKNNIQLATDPPTSQIDTNNSENVTVDSQEKISLILNDWDDNDSQEEGAPAIDENEKDLQSSNDITHDENISTVDNNDTNDNIATSDSNGKLDTCDINKDNNIKSLVSDWDEDEEEENKV